MNPKLFDIVVENITQKCLPDEDEAKLVSKLMLTVLQGETTAEVATQNRCISAKKLQDYVNAARIALKSFDAGIQQAVSHVRRSSTGFGQVTTDNAVTADEQEMPYAEQRLSPTDASSENSERTARVLPGTPSKKRCVGSSTEGVASACKKAKTIEQHDAEASDDAISEFYMPDVEVQIDPNAGDWAALSDAGVKPSTPATKKMKLKFSTLEDGTVVCGHCRMTFQTRSGVYNHYLKRHASAEDVFSCTQCNVKCLKQKALERHVLRKHVLADTPDDADEPSTSDYSLFDVGHDHASAAALPVDRVDVQDNSSSNNWLLSMCNVTVKKELAQDQAD